MSHYGEMFLAAEEHALIERFGPESIEDWEPRDICVAIARGRGAQAELDELQKTLRALKRTLGRL